MTADIKRGKKITPTQVTEWGKSLVKNVKIYISFNWSQQFIKNTWVNFSAGNATKDYVLSKLSLNLVSALKVCEPCLNVCYNSCAVCKSA